MCTLACLGDVYIHVYIFYVGKRLRRRAAALVQEEREKLVRELHVELDSERKLFEARKPALSEEVSGNERIGRHERKCARERRSKSERGREGSTWCVDGCVRERQKESANCFLLPLAPPRFLLTFFDRNPPVDAVANALRCAILTLCLFPSP